MPEPCNITIPWPVSEPCRRRASGGDIMEADCDDDLNISPKRPNEDATRQIPTRPPASKTTADHNMAALANAAAASLSAKRFNTGRPIIVVVTETSRIRQASETT
jgi:hypothetical protein